MTSRQTTLIIGAALLGAVLLVILVVVLVAGGGDGDSGSEAEIGQLTNPQDVPTATPWVEPPPIVELDPNALVPLPGEAGAATPAPTGGAGEPGVCGPKYTVAAGDTFSSIATKCGTTTQGMRDANPGVDPLTIHPGDVVNVPAAAP